MKARLLVAAVLLPLLLVLLLFLPTLATAIVMALVMALAAYELLWGSGLVKKPRLVIYTAVMAAAVPFWSYFGNDFTVAILGILLFMMVLFVELIADHGQLPFSQVCICLFGGILIPLMMTSLVRLQAVEKYGRFYILLPFVLSFGSDASAYFVGRFLGKHKLAPNISPKKTVEGAVGGVVGTVVLMIVYCLILDLCFDFTANYLYAVSYGIIGSLFAIVGDLVFSAVKRQTGIKDFGNILPGHGGMMDRLDSLLVVCPLAEVLLTLIPVVV